jgi:YggT family protein
MNELLAGYSLVVGILRRALFWLAVVAALVALVDWAVRTRRLNPFGPIARFFRRFIDPVMVPIERRIVRAGGQPSSAPWWTLVVVVVGGLLLIWVLGFLYGVLGGLAVGMNSPGAFARMLAGWAIALLRIALIVRIISTWFQISPYSKWIRWSYVLTEWMIAPLRRVLPPFGPVDVSPLVAFLLLWALQSVLGV